MRLLCVILALFLCLAALPVTLTAASPVHDRKYGLPRNDAVDTVRQRIDDLQTTIRKMDTDVEKVGREIDKIEGEIAKKEQEKQRETENSKSSTETETRRLRSSMDRGGGRLESFEADANTLKRSTR